MKKNLTHPPEPTGGRLPLKAVEPQTGKVPAVPVQPLTTRGGWLRYSPLFIVVAVLLVYFKVVGFDFVGVDDETIIKRRYFIIGDLSNIKLAFTTDAFLGTGHNFYRPLQTVSFMLDAFLGGPAPFIYHLTNLLLHIVASLSVWWLLLTLRYKQFPALLLGLLFALHPLFVPMVAWVPTRGDLLLTILSVAAFVLFIKSFRSNDPRLVYYHGIAYFLAFLAKETAVAIPPLCLAFYYFELRKSPAKKLIPRYFIAWAVGGAAWYGLRSLMHPPQLPRESFGPVAIENNLRIVPELLGKFFVPFHFQLLPLYTWVDTAIGLLTAVLLVWIVFRPGARGNVRLRLGLLWFLLFMFPVITFRNSIAQYIFDYLYHRSYVPSIGLIIILAELLARIKLPTEQYIWRLGLASVPVLIYCGIASSNEVGYYSDTITYLTEAAVRTPRNAMAYNNRGAFYSNDLKDYGAAIKDFTKAVEIFPSYVQAIVNRGLAYNDSGKTKEAMADLETALKMNPNDPDALIISGTLRYGLNDFAGALGDFNRSLAMDKLYPRVFSKKAGSEAMLGQAEQALKDADEALRIDPKDEEALNSRGLANRLLGKLDDAIDDFNEAINLQKTYSRPFNNRGVIYLARGERQKALDDFSKAIALDKHYSDAYSNRGWVEHELGKDELALKDFDAATKAKPNFASAYVNRGLVQASRKEFSSALTNYNRAIELAPYNAEAYLGRGILYTDHLGQYQAGIADFLKVLELQPTNANASVNIGIAFYKSQEFQKAVEQYSSLLKSQPGNAQLYYLRALASAGLKDYAHAVEDATKAKTLGFALDPTILTNWEAQGKSSSVKTNQ